MRARLAALEEVEAQKQVEDVGQVDFLYYFSFVLSFFICFDCIYYVIALDVAYRTAHTGRVYLVTPA